MKQWFKQLLPMLAGMAIITSQSTLAVQPVSDDELAEAASKNSLVLNEAVAENKVFIIQQDQSLSETPGYQMINILALLYPEAFMRELGQQQDYFTRNFGNESYSYRWAGNENEIWAQNQYYEVMFNKNTESYELNNVRGRVWINVEVFDSETGRTVSLASNE
ncbi:hypothetical protein MKI79_08895 [Acinetobacter sp. A3.8]|uniref:Uncharacterized protein n=1 Tax=Acinetobacter sedimenti TaxID=2919922 RepID=A0A9X1WY34_9GAMM|nr:hypothetical protein [Acinetobacter sedimenti]MCJ8147015.1 hypothetical protein [Acinetobacter sedimenti]